MTDLETNDCTTCFGAGEAPTDYGLVDCPDCGGAGTLPARSVLVEWRARDIENALQRGDSLSAEHGRWLLAELRRARAALNEVIALAHDAPMSDESAVGLQIRVAANRALGLYPPTSTPAAPGEPRDASSDH